MLISNLFNGGFESISKQLRFYCWHFRRNLDQRHRQELIELLGEQHFERLADKIKCLNQSLVTDSQQQIGKILFDHCLSRSRRHQLIQLIESRLVDINVRLDNYGRTLLHRSAYNLDVELVKILIDNDVNIRLRDYAGNTALHIAIQSYRNGAVIYGNEKESIRNLTAIIKLLLDADTAQQIERNRRKRVKILLNQEDRMLTSVITTDTKLEDSISSSNTASSDTNSISPVNFLAKNHSPCTQMTPSPACKLLKTNHLRESSSYSYADQKNSEFFRQTNQATDDQTQSLNPILLEDLSTPLVDTKNAFGRTPLHYCVMVVGERHLAHFVELLILYGADTDATDTRMKTPLYCLVKRAGVAALRQKSAAITLLLESGCDDLGLAIDPKTYFNDEFIKSLEENLSNIMQPNLFDSSIEPIFTQYSFKRVPSLKHMARLNLIRIQDDKSKLKRQMKLTLPANSPASLNLYVNRKILDQSELF